MEEAPASDEDWSEEQQLADLEVWNKLIAARDAGEPLDALLFVEELEQYTDDLNEILWIKIRGDLLLQAGKAEDALACYDSVIAQSNDENQLLAAGHLGRAAVFAFQHNATDCQLDVIYAVHRWIEKGIAGVHMIPIFEYYPAIGRSYVVEVYHDGDLAVDACKYALYSLVIEGPGIANDDYGLINYFVFMALNKRNIPIEERVEEREEAYAFLLTAAKFSQHPLIHKALSTYYLCYEHYDLPQSIDHYFVYLRWEYANKATTNSSDMDFIKALSVSMGEELASFYVRPPSRDVTMRLHEVAWRHLLECFETVVGPEDTPYIDEIASMMVPFYYILWRPALLNTKLYVLLANVLRRLTMAVADPDLMWDFAGCLNELGYFSRISTQGMSLADMVQAASRLFWLHTMPYDHYLHQPEWQERRKDKLQRAGYRCQVCNTKDRQLHVHHRTYERRGYEADEDLIVLCADCHETFHSSGRLAR